jgi:hypothetical protein
MCAKMKPSYHVGVDEHVCLRCDRHSHKALSRSCKLSRAGNG